MGKLDSPNCLSICGISISQEPEELSPRQFMKNIIGVAKMTKYYCKVCQKEHSEKYFKHKKYAKEKPVVRKSLDQLSKQSLLKRIEEAMTRMMGKIPDSVISENWNWDKFKLWISEPFWAMNYEEYDDSREI